MGELLGGGGQRVCWPPSQIIGEGGGASYAYEISRTPGTESYNLHHQPTTALLGVRKDIY